MQDTGKSQICKLCRTTACVVRYDLTDEEAYDLGRRSIYHATHRDAASGGIIRVYHMKPTGFEVISEQDCKDLHYMYAAEKK